MVSLWLYTIRGLRGAILGWGLSLAVLGGYVILFYDTVAAQREEYERLIAAMPRELLAFFGDIGQFGTPAGYLDTQLFSYLPLLLGVYAVLAGAALTAGPEEAGFLDLLLSCPVGRGSFLLARWLGFVGATAAILTLTWAGLAVGRSFSTSFGINPVTLGLPFVSLFAELVLFGTLSLFFSQLLPSKNAAAMAAGLVLGASFFATGLARVNPDLKPVARLLPLEYYQSAYAVSGLKMDWLAGLALTTAAFLLGALGVFRVRDIRTGGTGTLRLRLRWLLTGRR